MGKVARLVKDLSWCYRHGRVKTNLLQLDSEVRVGFINVIRRYVDGDLVDLEVVLGRLRGFRYIDKFFEFVYGDTDAEFIGWQVESGLFDWSRHSGYLVRYAPQFFRKDLFNWKEFSGELIRYAPMLFDKDLFNWEDFSGELVRYAVHLVDKDRLNWRRVSMDVLRDAPFLLKGYQVDLERLFRVLVDGLPFGFRVNLEEFLVGGGNGGNECSSG